MKINKTVTDDSKVVEKPEVGDKYVITIAEVIDTSRGYLARVKSFNTLTFDEGGISKLKKLPSKDKFEEEKEIAAQRELDQFLDSFIDDVENLEAVYMSPSNDVLRGDNFVKTKDLIEIINKYRSAGVQNES